MKMNKKGFTLIELLAVIVVLAIIALIATPIVMNTIKTAQEGANARSVEGYMKAYEAAYYEYMLNNGGSEPTAQLTTGIDYNGAEVKNCAITVSADKKFTATGCTVGTDTTTYKYTNGKAEKAA